MIKNSENINEDRAAATVLTKVRKQRKVWVWSWIWWNILSPVVVSDKWWLSIHQHRIWMVAGYGELYTSGEEIDILTLSSCGIAF